MSASTKQQQHVALAAALSSKPAAQRPAPAMLLLLKPHQPAAASTRHSGPPLLQPTWQAVARMCIVAEAVSALHHLHCAALPHLAHGPQLAATREQGPAGGQGLRHSRPAVQRHQLPPTAHRSTTQQGRQTSSSKQPRKYSQEQQLHLTVTPSRAHASWKPCSAASPSRHSCSARSSWRPSVSTGRYVHTYREKVGVMGKRVRRSARADG